MVAFYKHDVAAWRGGTASLTHEQYRVYHVIIEQMMVDEGEIFIHERMLSGLANMSPRAFRKAMNELFAMGKIILKDGQVSNVRVENELKSIRNNRENAKLGGKSKGSGLDKSIDQTEKHIENKGTIEAPLLSSMCPKRDREEEEKKERSARAPARLSDDGFDEWYDGFPNKVGKEAARRSFRSVIRKPGVTLDALKSGVERYIASKPPDRPWCNPSTWLNQGRWGDHPATDTAKQVAAASPPLDDPKIDFGGGVTWPEKSVIRAIQRFDHDPQSWPHIIGWPPGDPSCRVPPRLIDQARAMAGMAPRETSMAAE